MMIKTNKYPNGWYKLRWQILERDNFTCQYCGRTAPDVMLEVDHKISLADGGDNSPENLIASCTACNRGKSGLRQALLLSVARGKAHSTNHRDPASYQSAKVLEYLQVFHKGVTVSALCKHLSINDNRARVILSKLKRRKKVNNPSPGLWCAGAAQATISKSPDENLKSVCPTCNGLNYVPVQQEDAIRYKPCPDCEGAH